MTDELLNVQDLVAESRRAVALSQARGGTILIAVGESIYTMVDQSVLHDVALVRLRLFHAGVVLRLVAFLFPHDRRLSLRAIVWTTLLAVLPLLPIIWMGEQSSALSGKFRDPFVGHHLVLLGVAVFTPGPIWVSWAVLSVFATSSVINYLNLTSRVSFPLTEPVVTGLHVVVGMAILLLREKNDKLREMYEEARAAAQALMELAKIARAMRDGASSPLQTVVAATVLLRRHNTKEVHLLDRIDRAALRIQKLVVALDLYEPRWEELQQSFDAGTELGKQHDHLTAMARRAGVAERPGQP